jgi:hypothetical protein
MDPQARAYFEEIERRFIERRGRPLLLSPGDVARVARWHDDGVPLAAVLDGIDVHFERLRRREREPRRAVTLAYVEDDVLDAWAGVKRRRLGASPDASAAATRLATRAEHERLLAQIEDAARRLRDDDPRAALAEALDHAHERLASKAALFDEDAEEHDDERAEDHLRRLEKSLLERARAVLGEGEIARLEAEASEALAQRKLRMDARAHDRARQQLIDKALRERLGIARLSLFYT